MEKLNHYGLTKVIREAADRKIPLLGICLEMCIRDRSHAISDVIYTTFGTSVFVSGAVITCLTAVVILGGVKTISKVCEKLVPFMALFYIVSCIAILWINREFLAPAVLLIIRSAFTPQAAAGGFAGSTMMTACRYGMARGLFSNESGLGTAPIAAASAQTKNPVRQAMISMTGTFWDTVIVCAMTGIVVVSSMLHVPEAYTGVADDAPVSYTHLDVYKRQGICYFSRVYSGQCNVFHYGIFWTSYFY